MNINLVANCAIRPKMKAIATENRIPRIIFVAELLLMTCQASLRLPILSQAKTSAAPSNSKTTDTVVEVGRPNVEKRSKRMMSAKATAVKMIMASERAKFSG